MWWSDSMNVIDGDAFVIQVSLDELRLLASSIGEALEAVDDWEFSTRLGADPRTHGHFGPSSRGPDIAVVAKSPTSH
jgi:hypothetical protein